MYVEYTTIEEINDVSMGRPHVVILGAGASVAAFPDGDANGRKLPVMLDFVETLGLTSELEAAGIKSNRNFEDIYSDICERPSLDLLRARLEHEVHQYFSSLRLPPGPTLYDQLVLSLREKDVVATFNWDPFLCEALERTRGIARGPKPLFLHGSVALSTCATDKKSFTFEDTCELCGERTVPSKLLYPIRSKDYSSDPFINVQWRNLRAALKNAFMLTIFGYGAPSSDADAVELMSKAWGRASDRQLEQIELINISPTNEVVEGWRKFIHTHHYEVKESFYDSWSAKHPRRSCEAAWQQIVEAKFIDENRIPAGVTFDELDLWIQNIAIHELAGQRRPS